MINKYGGAIMACGCGNNKQGPRRTFYSPETNNMANYNSNPHFENSNVILNMNARTPADADRLRIQQLRRQAILKNRGIH